MRNDIIPAHVLSVKIIADVDKQYLKSLDIEGRAESLGVFTCDSDDVAYAALDEATKKANVFVAYARSLYAGSDNANTKLAGEFIGVLAGPDPAEVRSGLDAAVNYAENVAHFVSANDDNSIKYFAHLISSTGEYLSTKANVKLGTPMAYLIAPPLEAMVALDAALKAADVKLSVFYGPPTETNFAGALLTGEQYEVEAAVNAFADRIQQIADNPLAY